MKNTPLYPFTLLLIAAVYTLGGCAALTSESSGEIRRQQPMDQRQSNVNATHNDIAALEEVVVYEVNEEVLAGDVAHMVTSVEFLDAIPADYTIPSYAAIAEESPAADGFEWAHLVGTVTNNTNTTQTVNSLTYTVEDQAGRQYDAASSDVVLYVESAKAPVSITVQPTQTVEWETYFLVPSDATTLQLVATDLQFLPEHEARIRIKGAGEPGN